MKTILGIMVAVFLVLFAWVVQGSEQEKPPSSPTGVEAPAPRDFSPTPLVMTEPIQTDGTLSGAADLVQRYLTARQALRESDQDTGFLPIAMSLVDELRQRDTALQQKGTKVDPNPTRIIEMCLSLVALDATRGGMEGVQETSGVCRIVLSSLVAPK